jgi:cysteine protease ATG4
MYVPSDPVVYIDKVVQACTQPRHPQLEYEQEHEQEHAEESGDDDRQQAPKEDAPTTWRSVFILIPMRLGVDKINPIYFQTILTCLRMPQSVGIIGGKPKQAYWFVGYQDEHLIFLDPHIVQESLQPSTLFSDESYHCSVPQKVHISEVDPSLAIGFYCHTKEDFENFCSAIEEMSKTSAPIFTIEQEEPVYESDED